MKQLIALSARVEESVKKAYQALAERDVELARRVIDTDEEIDKREIDVEEECLKILALHQPVAIDLRYLVAVLKINSDLERIGDLAQNIAYNAADIASAERMPFDFDLEGIYNNVQAMLKECLDAVVKQDVEAAYGIMDADDEVDRLHRGIVDEILEAIKKRPEDVKVFHHYMNVTRHLERIADHVTNIAEDIIYLMEGDIVRHSSQDDA